MVVVCVAFCAVPWSIHIRASDAGGAVAGSAKAGFDVLAEREVEGECAAAVVAAGHESGGAAGGVGVSSVSSSGVGAGVGVCDAPSLSMAPVSTPSMIAGHPDGSESARVMASALSSRVPVRAGAKTVRDF